MAHDTVNNFESVNICNGWCSAFTTTDSTIHYACSTFVSTEIKIMKIGSHPHLKVYCDLDRQTI